MTCIVGLRAPDGVVMGGDSAGIGNMDLHVRADEKVFARSGGGADWLFGFTSSFRMGQLIRYSLKLPKVPGRDGDLYRYMVTKFVDACRDCFKSGGFAQKHKEEESAGTFLVGVRGSLFTVYGDYQVAQEACGFASVGCGGEIARGSLHATAVAAREAQPWRIGPRRRVEMALQAAEQCSAEVRGPFVILEGARRKKMRGRR